MKRPSYIKSHHVPAPVLVNNRFEILATQDTAETVLADTHSHALTFKDYNLCTQKSDPDHRVHASDPQASINATVVTSEDYTPSSPVVSSSNIHCARVSQLSQDDNSSPFSQPNAFVRSQLSDYKANEGVPDPTYSNTAIPLRVWDNRFQCVDYQRCIHQNGFEFGAVPLTAIKLYEEKQTCNQPITDIIRLHTIICQSNCPKVLGCRIPVQTQLKPRAWRFHLRNYWDQQLPNLIEYGFPIDFDRSRPLTSTEVNHVSGYRSSVA